MAFNFLAVSSPVQTRQSESWRLSARRLTACRKSIEETLARYYTYLSANLSLPFTAYYPQPMNPQEKTQFRCTVLELLDPTQYLGDEFDGIFCQTRKGKFEVNLPLIELHVPHDSPTFNWLRTTGTGFGTGGDATIVAAAPEYPPSRAMTSGFESTGPLAHRCDAS